jgi:hypothetical protein
VRFDPRQLVRREGEDYPLPGMPAADSECDGDPILQRLQSIMVEVDADSPEGRRMLSTAPVPRMLDSEGDSLEVELLHQAPCVVLNPERAAEDLRPAIVARRLWEAAEVPLLPPPIPHTLPTPAARRRPCAPVAPLLPCRAAPPAPRASARAGAGGRRGRDPAGGGVPPGRRQRARRAHLQLHGTLHSPPRPHPPSSTHSHACPTTTTTTRHLPPSLFNPSCTRHSLRSLYAGTARAGG